MSTTVTSIMEAMMTKLDIMTMTFSPTTTATFNPTTTTKHPHTGMYIHMVAV